MSEQIIAQFDGRMAVAFSEAAVLERDRRVNQGANKFDYASAEQIKRVASEALVKAGLFIEGITVQVLKDFDLETKGGAKMLAVVCHATVKVAGYSYEGIGAAQDYGAVGYLKAQTSAVREALKNMLAMSTMDREPEDGEPVEPPPRAKPAQQQKGVETKAPEAPKLKPMTAATKTKLVGQLKAAGFQKPSDCSELCMAQVGVSFSELDEDGAQKLIKHLDGVLTDGEWS